MNISYPPSSGFIFFYNFIYFKKICHINKSYYIIGNKCPFCTELLPYPLPSKIRFLLKKIAEQNGKFSKFLNFK